MDSLEHNALSGGHGLQDPHKRNRDNPCIPGLNLESTREGSDSSVDRTLKRAKRLRITIPKLEGNSRIYPEAIISPSYHAKALPRIDRERYSGPNYAVCRRRGRRRYMEDTHCAMPELVKERKIGFFGVFDGHGGTRCADYSAKNLAKLVSQDIDQTPRSLFQGAFKKLDEQFLSLARSKRWNDGSTVVAALIRNRTLTIANAGDSKAVLSAERKAVVMSREHNPGLSEEKSRIEKKGGAVIFCRQWRVQAVLSISRAIGNQKMKEFVTSQPDVTTRILRPGDDFLILGTDGLWDYVGEQEAVEIACERLKHGLRLEDTAQVLTDLAFNRGSSDNITALIVDLRSYGRA